MTGSTHGWVWVWATWIFVVGAAFALLWSNYKRALVSYLAIVVSVLAFVVWLGLEVVAE